MSSFYYTVQNAQDLYVFYNNEPCSHYCASSPCEEWDQQCQEQIGHNVFLQWLSGGDLCILMQCQGLFWDRVLQNWLGPSWTILYILCTCPQLFVLTCTTTKALVIVSTLPLKWAFTISGPLNVTGSSVHRFWSKILHTSEKIKPTV